MSTSRGIFDSIPSQPTPPWDSPFGIAPAGPEPALVASPFTAVPEARPDSPFSVFHAAEPAAQPDAGRAVRLPERRKAEPSLYAAETDESFGFEAQAKGYVPVGFAHSGGPPVLGTSPFMVESAPAQMPQGFGAWPGNPLPQGFAPQSQAYGYPSAGLAADPAPVQVPTIFAPAATPAAQATYMAPAAAAQSDSYAIRQLELRAIFQVDREMSEEEILRRSRTLPGIRSVARLQAQDAAAIESLKHLSANLGFGGAELKLYSGAIPLEFIREGAVTLAIQTDGGFAPGTREILMLVARELGRMHHA